MAKKTFSKPTQKILDNYARVDSGMLISLYRVDYIEADKPKSGFVHASSTNDARKAFARNREIPIIIEKVEAV